MTSRDVFQVVLESLQEEYPHRKISMKSSSYGTIVLVDGVERMNIDGFNLLFNLSRLVEELSDELL